MERECTDTFSATIVGHQVPHIVKEFVIRELRDGKWVEVGREYILAASEAPLKKIRDDLFEALPQPNAAMDGREPTSGMTHIKNDA